jgi:acyl carrier protein
MSLGTEGTSVSTPEVLARLAAIIRLVTGQPVEQVQPDRHFVDDLRIDSLSMVEILEGAAQDFDVRIDDEDAKDFVRVRDLVDYLVARVGAGLD